MGALGIGVGEELGVLVGIVRYVGVSVGAAGRIVAVDVVVGEIITTVGVLTSEVDSTWQAVRNSVISRISFFIYRFVDCLTKDLI